MLVQWVLSFSQLTLYRQVGSHHHPLSFPFLSLLGSAAHSGVNELWRGTPGEIQWNSVPSGRVPCPW